MNTESGSQERTLRWCLVGLFGVVAGVLVLVYLISPMNARRTKVEDNLKKLLRGTEQALDSVSQLPETQQQCAALGQMLGAETNRFVLRPVLGSFPFQRDIYRLAAETGFNVDLVREIGRTATPATAARARKPALGKRPAAGKPDAPGAAPWLARYLVEITGEGSYAVVMALIERLEQENPYCGVNALAIRGLPNNFTRHRVNLSLEWPVAAEPPAARPAGRAR